MRNNLKTQIVEIINTLKDAELSLEQGISNKNTDILNVIADLQDAAIQIGNVIEASEGEGHYSVICIERYCETLWFLYEKLNKGDFDCVREYTLTKSALADVQKSIEEIKGRKEVVFLPYKVSMWDSLESVWKKYSEDDNYDTYVIPIPYYDKNSDGTIGEMHYEGYEYPDYVTITHYDEYDIANRKPDKIYIHNPYDGYNKITTVSPKFYSKELRKHTDMLTYIPYFVAYDSDVEKHFCTLPGVLYSHKVIVQSEKARAIYIDEIHKFEVEFDCKNAFGNVEDKIIAGGSPKFDKVINAKKEDYILPDSWRRLIYSKNNKRKKVVLYSITIKSMICNPEKLMDKIENVFRIFRNNSDVVLVWRPHPLLKASLKSMREEYMERYIRIEKTYKTEGWGIFDDSPDMYRAIAWSDAYYGDGGSVVEIYRKTGKPIMLQNVDIQ